MYKVCLFLRKSASKVKKYKHPLPADFIWIFQGAKERLSCSRALQHTQSSLSRVWSCEQVPPRQLSYITYIYIALPVLYTPWEQETCGPGQDGFLIYNVFISREFLLEPLQLSFSSPKATPLQLACSLILDFDLRGKSLRGVFTVVVCVLILRRCAHEGHSVVLLII